MGTTGAPGRQRYQDYYYIFDDRDVPDMFEGTMPESSPNRTRQLHV